MTNLELLREENPFFISIVEKTMPGKPSVVEFGFATKLTEKQAETNASSWRSGLFYTHATLGSHVPDARGYFTLWSNGRAVGLSHPKAQDFLKEHGLTLDDFHKPVTQPAKPGRRQVTKVRRIKKDRLVQSTFVTFGPQLTAKDGTLIPGIHRIEVRPEPSFTSLETLSVDELRDLALANSVNLGRSSKKETILKKLQDAGVTL